jgi:hypothetical protein
MRIRHDAFQWNSTKKPFSPASNDMNKHLIEPHPHSKEKTERRRKKSK